MRRFVLVLDRQCRVPCFAGIRIHEQYDLDYGRQALHSEHFLPMSVGFDNALDL